MSVRPPPQRPDEAQRDAGRASRGAEDEVLHGVAQSRLQRRPEEPIARVLAQLPDERESDNCRQRQQGHHERVPDSALQALHKRPAGQAAAERVRDGARLSPADRRADPDQSEHGHEPKRHRQQHLPGDADDPPADKPRQAHRAHDRGGAVSLDHEADRREGQHAEGTREGQPVESGERAHGEQRRYRVIALFGPTGIGKTAVAIALAERLRARGEDPVAISADALQVYSGLELLTGAAGAEERAALEHRLLSFVPVTERFSAGRFAELARAEIDAALEAGRRPIVVGGTGLYLQAALTDLELRPPPPPELRERLTAELETSGAAALHARLAARDAGAAAAVDPGDRTRIIRALELLEMGESPAPAGEGSRLWTAELRHPTRLAGLVMARAELYRRTDARVDAIVAAGALDEVRRADAAGASATARKALGFDELLRGDVDGMKRRTRNLARRQLTWMRRLEGVDVIDAGGRSPAELAERLLSEEHR